MDETLKIPSVYHFRYLFYIWNCVLSLIRIRDFNKFIVNITIILNTYYLLFVFLLYNIWIVTHTIDWIRFFRHIRHIWQYWWHDFSMKHTILLIIIKKILLIRVFTHDKTSSINKSIFSTVISTVTSSSIIKYISSWSSSTSRCHNCMWGYIASNGAVTWYVF